jgi:hypothetical protein
MKQKMESIESFCVRNQACENERAWALETCKTMDDVWKTAKPECLIWAATRKGVLDDKTLRLFTCWSVRRVWHLLTDERSRNAVEIAEKFAVGEASRAALAAALDAAWEAAWAAAGAAARDAQCDWLRKNAKPNFGKPHPLVGSRNPKET